MKEKKLAGAALRSHLAKLSRDAIQAVVFYDDGVEESTHRKGTVDGDQDAPWDGRFEGDGNFVPAAEQPLKLWATSGRKDSRLDHVVEIGGEVDERFAQLDERIVQPKHQSVSRLTSGFQIRATSQCVVDDDGFRIDALMWSELHEGVIAVAEARANALFLTKEERLASMSYGLYVAEREQRERAQARTDAAIKAHQRSEFQMRRAEARLEHVRRVHEANAERVRHLRESPCNIPAAKAWIASAPDSVLALPLKKAAQA
ncbi:MAG: hypothetical protein Q7R62_02440 [bacterium]|nr:hypothetical protein [bacterium]